MAEFDIHNLEDLKYELEIAAMTDRALPPIKTAGAKSSWPDFLHDPFSVSAMIKDSPSFSPTQEDIDKWEIVCSEWIKFFDETERQREWAIIWMKACRMPSKIIERRTGLCRTSVWYLYERGMRKLFAALAHRPLSKTPKKTRIRSFSRDIITIREAIERLEGKMKNNY